MSYDFAVLTPQAAGSSEQSALLAAFSDELVAGQSDERLVHLLADLEAVGALDEDSGWLSMWPLDTGSGGLFVPTTYADLDNNLGVLLRIASTHGLVLVDLQDETVYPPALGEPVSVMSGDGTRLGAVTYARLSELVQQLAKPNPWLVLVRGEQDYVQTRGITGGSYEFEYRNGSPDKHFATVLNDRVEIPDRMWGWLTQSADWDAGITWKRLTL